MTTAAQAQYAASQHASEASDLNTIPDPRAPSPMTLSRQSPSPSSQHPDLSNEVAALSAKLINAINNQAKLDDALQQTRHELEEARAHITKLEQEIRLHEDAVASGVLVKWADIERKEERLERQMAEEQKKRDSAERQRKGMESELENLTGQLFEEANAMVAQARHEKQESDRRADMFKTKLEDTEVLLQSQQAQLKQLKEVLSEERHRNRDSIHSATTAPATPVIGSNGGDKISSATMRAPMHTRNAHSCQSLPPPESPLYFDHLIHPVVRTDVQSYEDFLSLLRTNRGSTPPSRSASGSYNVGLNVLGLVSKDSSSQSTVIPSIRSAINPASRSTSNQTTPTPGSGQSPRPDDSEGPGVSLKDTKYFKRALTEDIEPTLRLDSAPGLSWLGRRTVLASITSGRLIVEPFPPRHAYHSPAFACSMCGETRTSNEHIRRYRFRASDSDEAQRYPVCDYCLARVRSTCDFTSFLRMAKNGVMKNETIDECRAAWEECIKLREKMFWSRVGGGVVPAPSGDPVSPSPGGELEADKDISEPGSQSDSDLASISRADSQRTTSSGQPEITPLSEAEASERLPPGKILPNGQNLAPALHRELDKPQTDPESSAPSTAATRNVDPIALPSPTGPSHKDSQEAEAGARDASTIRQRGESVSQPSSSADIERLRHTETTQALEGQASTSPSEVALANPFKKPTVPASASRPSSARDSRQFSPLDTTTIAASDTRNSPQEVSPKRVSSSFPRPISSHSTKSFFFGPRDGKVLPGRQVDSAISDAEESAILDGLTTRTTASPSVHKIKTPSGNDGKPIVSDLAATFAPKSSHLPAHQPRPDSKGRDSQSSPVRSNFSAFSSNNFSDQAGVFKASISTSSQADTPSIASRGRPLSTAGGLTTTPPKLSPSPRGRPVSLLPSTSNFNSSVVEPLRHAQPSSSPKATPRESISSTPPRVSAFSTPRMSLSDAQPQLPPSAPSTPSQQPSKRPSKVAALASKFGGNDDVVSPTATPPQLRPTSRASEKQRPDSRGSGMMSQRSSPERLTLGSPERKPLDTIAGARSRTGSAVEEAMASLGSPERVGRIRGESIVQSRSRGGSDLSGKARGGSEGGPWSRPSSPVKGLREREGSDLSGRSSRSMSPVKIPGAFA
ncbi:MAG: hypothetical protein Q9162_003867 [Coniocarpon cinnabarinum]